MGVKKYQLYTLSKHFKKRAKKRFGIEADACQKWFNSVAQRAKEYKKKKCSNPNRLAYITSDKILFILDVSTYKAITCYKYGRADELEDILVSPEANQPTPTMETDATPIIEIAKSLPSAPITSVEHFAEADEIVKFSSISADNTDDGFHCLSEAKDVDIPVSKEDKFIDINNNNYATFEEEVLRLERRANLKNAKEFLQVIEEDVERFYKNYQRIKNGVLSDKNYEHLQELNRDVNVIVDAFKFLKVMEQEYKLLNNK